jgi:hypothetical protein
MPDFNKDLAASSLSLRPWDEFTRDMAPFMDQFDEVLREHILIALYDRASFRAWLEDLRFKEAKRAPILRKERLHGERIRRHVQRAIRALDKAIEVAQVVGEPEHVRETEYVREAKALLKRTVEDLSFLEELRIALVHPARQNKYEKARKIASACRGFSSGSKAI